MLRMIISFMKNNRSISVHYGQNMILSVYFSENCIFPVDGIPQTP